MQSNEKAQSTTTTTKPTKRPGLKSVAGPSHEHDEKTTNGMSQRYFYLPVFVKL
jgi:hypothetical protein